jgi:hypothetical protein
MLTAVPEPFERAAPKRPTRAPERCRAFQALSRKERDEGYSMDTQTQLAQQEKNKGTASRPYPADRSTSEQMDDYTLFGRLGS